MFPGLTEMPSLPLCPLPVLEPGGVTRGPQWGRGHVNKRLSLSQGPVQQQSFLDPGFWSLRGEAHGSVEAGPQLSAWSYPFVAEDENTPAQMGLHDGCGEATKCPSLITSPIWFPA